MTAVFMMTVSGGVAPLDNSHRKPSMLKMFSKAAGLSIAIAYSIDSIDALDTVTDGSLYHRREHKKYR